MCSERHSTPIKKNGKKKGELKKRRPGGGWREGIN